eukprot:gene9877-20549_t
MSPRNTSTEVETAIIYLFTLFAVGHNATYRLFNAEHRNTDGYVSWSRRVYEALLKNSIPVILSNGIVEPFERYLGRTKFSAKFNTDYISISNLSFLERMYDAGDEHREWHRQLHHLHLTNISSFSSSSTLSSTTSSPLQNDEDNNHNSNNSNSTLHHQQQHHNHSHSSLPYIQKKLHMVREAATWFQWDTTTNRSVWKLIILELWCRTPEGLSQSICKESASHIANEEYW